MFTPYSLIFVTADDLVFACRLNRNGQPGVGDTERRRLPTLVTGQLQGKTAVHISAGDYHTPALHHPSRLAICLGLEWLRSVGQLIGCWRHKGETGANAGYNTTVHVARSWLHWKFDAGVGHQRNVTISAITSNTIWTLQYLIYITFTSHTSHPTS